MSERQLNVGVVGGLGTMASPMARHWKKDGPVQVLRVHDRGTKDQRRGSKRHDWANHGALLVPTFEELVGQGDLDGVIVCCGKNGDDLAIIASITELLSKSSQKSTFICHMSTVSVSFVELAYQFCRQRNVRYVNYPLTGSASGAEAGTMLILASGDLSLYNELLASLSLLGTPRHFGAKLAAGAEVKFIGHLMVFNGLIGICSAAALHAECFNNSKIGGSEQAAFFDFLNTGAGGTRQWDVILSSGVRDNVWDAPFSLKYAVVDAIYVAQLCLDKHISSLVVEHVLNTALAFSYVLNNIDINLATHSIVREMIAERASAFDRFLLEHSARRGDTKSALEKCIRSLPERIRKTVALDLTINDFERVLCPA